MGGKGNNPSIRLLKYDRATGHILDIQQYYLNLDEANEKNDDDWKLAYQATEYYNIPDFGTDALADLNERFLHDDQLFDKYYKANGVFYDPSEQWTEEFRRIHYCSIAEMNYDRWSNCNQAISGSSWWSAPNLCLFSITLIAGFIFKK